MTDPTDAAVEALAKTLTKIYTHSGITLEHRITAVARHVLTSRQPKPEDVELLAEAIWPEFGKWMMKDGPLPWRFVQRDSPVHYGVCQIASAILALYDAPPQRTPSAADCAPTETEERLTTALSQRNAYKAALDAANARIATLEAELAAASNKGDAEMERVKACEHIAIGDDGWRTIRNLCPSTAAVAALRDAYEATPKIIPPGIPQSGAIRLGGG